MPRNKPKSLPQFGSLDALVEFFDTNDLGEYWQAMPEAHFDVDLKKRTHLVAIETELADKLSEIAKTKQVPSQGLVNSWLKEKLMEQA